MPFFEFVRSFASSFQGTSTPTITGTSESSIIPAGTGSPTIPANRLRAGCSVRLLMRGVMSAPLVAGTMTVRVKLNGTVISSGTSAQVLGSMTKAGWNLNQTMTIRSDGPNGTAVVAGDVTYPAGLITSQSKTDLLSDPAAPFSIDTTVDNTLNVTIQFSLASHQVWTSTCTIEILDPLT
jgi:hypothetical protein